MLTHPTIKTTNITPLFPHCSPKVSGTGVRSPGIAYQGACLVEEKKKTAPYASEEASWFELADIDLPAAREGDTRYLHAGCVSGWERKKSVA